MRPGSFTRRKDEYLPDLRPLVRFARSCLDLEVEGLERVPRKGMTVLVANHGGWLAFDGVMVAALIYDRYGPDRVPVGFVEDILLRLPVLGPFVKRLGAVGISDFHKYEELSRKHEVFGIFPEGTEGNCKPLSEAYRLQEFRRGFVRLALSLQARVLPVTILGGDETFPVLYKWRSPKSWLGSIVPIPMSVIPVPVRWKVVFHEPLDFSQYDPALISDREFCHERADEVRGIIQQQLDLEVIERGAFPMAINRTRVFDWIQRRMPGLGHMEDAPVRDSGLAAAGFSGGPGNGFSSGSFSGFSPDPAHSRTVQGASLAGSRNAVEDASRVLEAAANERLVGAQAETPDLEPLDAPFKSGRVRDYARVSPSRVRKPSSELSPTGAGGP